MQQASMLSFFLRILQSTVLICGLCACAHFTPQESPPIDPTIAWQHHQQQLQTITHWTIAGRLGFKTSNDGGSASLVWKHSEHQYLITLSGPLGQGKMTIEGAKHHVIVRDHDGNTHSATDPQQLLKRLTGLNLPVAYLRFWLRGLPVTQVTNTYTLDDFGRLATLQQDGWQIEYRGYQKVSLLSAGEPLTLTLPRKLAIRNTKEKISLKVFIRTWR